MKTLPPKYKTLFDNCLNTLWAAWRSLGVFSDGKIIPVCPEEALAGLALFGRYDQRLFDEALSAALTFKTLFSDSRLNHLQSKMNGESAAVFQIILHLLSVKNPAIPVSSKIPVNFFISPTGKEAFSGRIHDPFFQKQGWLRNPFTPSSKVRPLPYIAGQNPWIRAKLIFGNTARVDVIIALLEYPEITAPDIARNTGYTQKTLWNILTDFQSAEMVKSRMVGNRKFYSLTAYGKERLRFLKPSKQKISIDSLIKTGSLINRINELPDNASAELVASIEAEG
jgi:DNA-binding MarR family transcriptional regulator